MKEEGVLNVLMYLFHYHIKESCELRGNTHNIIHALEEAGFETAVINEAISWLEMLVKDNGQLTRPPRPTSTRVFTRAEREVIDMDCLNFIISLEQQGILTPETREMVLNQAMALETSEIVDLSLIKWVTLMVLFNQPESENALDCMEFLVLDNTLGGVH